MSNNIPYGDDEENQYIRIYGSNLPNIQDSTTFIILHGGFWKSFYSLDCSAIDTLQPFLSEKGCGVCLVEYRRVGQEGGGYPGTINDIILALKKFYEYSQVFLFLFIFIFL